MISKNKARFIISLKNKKVRDEERLFVIEGDKLVKEFITAKIPIKTIIAKPEFLSGVKNGMSSLINETIEVSYEELKQISTLKTPHNALAIIEMPVRNLNIQAILENLCVALDFVQDPGNLGTIIRAAAWFGIKNIVCSNDCVDLYNPKVIQASMGAILHVDVYYSGLPELVFKAREMKLPVFGALLEGESIYKHKLSNKGIILLGNESKGVSQELLPFITDKIMIPAKDQAMPGRESLNVSMAASVIFSEFLRRSFSPPVK